MPCWTGVSLIHGSGEFYMVTSVFWWPGSRSFLLIWDGHPFGIYTVYSHLDHHVSIVWIVYFNCLVCVSNNITLRFTAFIISHNNGYRRLCLTFVALLWDLILAMVVQSTYLMQNEYKFTTLNVQLVDYSSDRVYQLIVSVDVLYSLNTSKLSSRPK